MLSYSHASIHSSMPEDYVLLIHGRNNYDAYIQLGDFVTMESWQACLNQDIMKQQQQYLVTVSAALQQASIKSSEDKVSIGSRRQLRRRRSKSDPTSLLTFHHHDEQLEEPPLDTSSLSVASTQSNHSQSSSPSVSLRKRCKTYNNGDNYQ